MMLVVLAGCDARQVCDVVVEWVMVDVVDVVPVRDGAVSGLPEFLVEVPVSALSVPDARGEVDACGAGLGVGVAAVSDALEHD